MQMRGLVISCITVLLIISITRSRGELHVERIGLVENPKETIEKGLEKGLEKTKEAVKSTADFTKRFTNSQLRKLGFSADEMYEAVACVGPILDMLQKISENPHDYSAYERLKHDRCRGLIKEFSFKCVNPTILTATAIPHLGVAISKGCAIVEKAEDRINKAFEESQKLYEEHKPEVCPKPH